MEGYKNNNKKVAPARAAVPQAQYEAEESEEESDEEDDE